MPQKYKVFIEERPLLITAKAPEDSDNSDFSLHLKPDDRRQWTEIYALLSSGQETGILVETKDVENSFRAFSQLFDLAEAAGGLVRDAKGQYLFILRNARWDLPKGKLEPGEGSEEGAIREVEEECGLADLRILAPLQTTWHTYERKGRNYLKPTYWYLMEIPDLQTGSGQLEEGIEALRWFKADELPEVLLQTFPNIRELVSGYLSRPIP